MLNEGLTAEAARKRLSRIKEPILRFPVQLLPKNESFIYLQDQRKDEKFWINFLYAMRASGSAFGLAIDGLLARNGIVTEEEFSVISGSPSLPMKKQLMTENVIKRLLIAGVIERTATSDGNSYICILRSELGHPDKEGLRGCQLTESIVLDALRELVRKIGFGSYNKIMIRGDSNRTPIGPFMFDLAGPSYLLPLKGSGPQPGFFVADVFVNKTLDENHINYFIRKTSMLNSVLKGSGVLAVLVADGFTGTALTKGHAAGISLATPKDLFGQRVGVAIQTLLQTLNNAAAYASSAPDRLTKLIDDLSEIEGAAGNLRGILFELLAAYLARRDAVSIDMGIHARDPGTGKTADIDILKFTSQKAECVAIECKGKYPGGQVSLEEAQEWVRRLPIFKNHLRSQSHLRETILSFELWTSGSFSEDALEYLNKEKGRRVKQSISWKDGVGILTMAHNGKEKAIADTLNQHFMRHPLNDVAVTPYRAILNAPENMAS